MMPTTGRPHMVPHGLTPRSLLTSVNDQGMDRYGVPSPPSSVRHWTTEPTGHWMGSEGAEAAEGCSRVGGGETISRPSYPGHPGYMGQEAVAVELKRTPPRTLVRMSSPLACQIEDQARRRSQVDRWVGYTRDMYDMVCVG